MKKILHRMRKYGRGLAFLLAFAMILVMGNGVQAAENAGEAYDGEVLGSIKVVLGDSGGEDKKDVQINLYQVGTLDTSEGYLDFSLVEELKDTDVDLNDITTPEANADVAEKLASAVKEQKLDAAASLWTDEKGEAVFENLPQGMYLVTEENANAYGMFSPSVVPVPYGSQTDWNYDVEISPKATPVTTLGRIDVTKTVKGIGSDGNLQDVSADNATYYVGLFMDPDGGHPYGENGNNIKAVHIIDGNSGTVSFDNIPITDDPYYIFETDEDGRPLTYLEQQDGENGFYCMAGEVLGAEDSGQAPVIVMEKEAGSVGTATISNVYTGDLPDGYYYTGEITITKSVMSNGQMIASDDVFYAGVFPVDAQGNVNTTPVEIVKLNNNAAVTVEVPLGGTDGTEAITYAVRETNEQGVPVSQDSTFLYEVTGEGNVALSMDQTTGTVNITNTLGAADGYYQEEPSTQAPNDPGTGNANNRSNANDNGSNNDGNNSQSGGTSSGTGRSSSSARTGDDNQIFLYAGLLAAAVIVGGVVVVRRRRRTNG